jgi:phospholipase A-2-activating protein
MMWVEGGECTQVIAHPCVSVWATAFMQNGDVVSGGSDGIVRVFSRDPSRRAPDGVIQTFNEAVAATAIPKNQTGDLNPDKVPGPEILYTQGKKDGQAIVVKQPDGSIDAYQWSMAQRDWQKVGQVVDAIGENRKQLYQGKEYDHVFDVEMEGLPPLKLPYNVTGKPLLCA